jgi:hypothetical protein
MKEITYSILQSEDGLIIINVNGEEHTETFDLDYAVDTITELMVENHDKEVNNSGLGKLLEF